MDPVETVFESYFWILTPKELYSFEIDNNEEFTSFELAT